MWTSKCIENTQFAYTPTQEDVFAVRRHLLQYLPAELAVMITEYAQYWPSVSSTREALTGPASIQTGWDEEWCYLLSPPIPTYEGLTVKPRRVNFTISCDAECTYEGVCSGSTVFEAAVIKSNDVAQNILLEPIEVYPERQIHRWNITNPNRWLIHDIESPESSLELGAKRQFSLGEPQETVPSQLSETNAGSDSKAGPELPTGTVPDTLLETLTPGDRVAVMVRGLIPGWMNCIYTITTDIQYSI
ncbi:hypothetical protein FA15DRAFT_659644 [Coprinopsis marcescibilis]|uniref:Uncharacterized protein n=1 Tax=Coprinopsis marcescibilis TaxID=230819 RepID=A0A5C3KIV5_COPMA|nr:hypothetical protein FA15DRAFT_659644 [Coprinopsis marcescibilis]